MLDLPSRVEDGSTHDPRCPVCGSGKVHALGPHRDFDGCTILECDLCTHGFTSPEPTKAELDRYYREVYGPVRRRYFGPLYYEIMRRRARAQIDLLLEHMPADDLRGTTICDVGCGIGAAVAESERRGAEVLGLDSDVEAIDIGRELFGTNLRVGDLCGAADNRRFDVLLMSHVVEHLRELQRTMATILGHLKTGGFLFVEVPTTYPVIFTERMDTEGHLQFFTRRSLSRLMKPLGLETLTLRSCGPHIDRLIDEHRRARVGPLRRWLGGWARKARASTASLYAAESFTRYDRDEPRGIWLRGVARLVRGTT